MEKIYKILKIAIVLLLAAVISLAAWQAVGGHAEVPAETAMPEENTEAERSTAPDFTVYDVDGNAYKLSDFQGKPVILNFWASWCGPCKSEMPDIEESYKAYGDKIQFLIVNLTDGSSETVDTASGYIAEQGYTFPVYYDTAMEAALAYSIYAIPATYFIDAEGGIAHSVTGMMDADTLQQGIDLLLSGN